MIIQGVADGSISKAEAKLLVNQQKIAASFVLTAAEGMSVLCKRRSTRRSAW